MVVPPTCSVLKRAPAMAVSRHTHRCIPKCRSSPIPPQPIPTDRLVNRLPQPVDPADRPMLRQRVPGVERKVVTEQVLFPAIKILSWHNDVGYGSEGRVRLLPFDAGVFDGHVLGRVLALHLEGVAGGVRSMDSCWYRAARRKLGRSWFCFGSW